MVMLGWSPAEQVAMGPWPELRHETPAQTEARYKELADAAITVASTNPPLFAESEGRTRTALLLLSLAFFESRFHNRVTTAATKKELKEGRSDHGRSWCAVQINIGRDGIGKRKGGHLERLIPEGWTGQELEADPVKCLTVGYRFAADSLTKYGHLGGYTGEGRNGPKARHRLDKARDVVLLDTSPELASLVGMQGLPR